MGHVYKAGRTQCNGKAYRTGFSPCELALAGADLNALDKLVHGQDQCIAKLEDGDPCTFHQLDPWHTDPTAAAYHKFRGRKRLSDADMQAAADILGLSRCIGEEAKERVAEKRRLRVRMEELKAEMAQMKAAGATSAIAHPSVVADVTRAYELGVVSDSLAIELIVPDYNSGGDRRG